MERVAGIACCHQVSRYSGNLGLHGSFQAEGESDRLHSVFVWRHVPAAENRGGMHVCIVRSAPFAGQDIVLRLFLPTVEEADQWAQKLSVAQLPQLPLYQLSFDFK